MAPPQQPAPFDGLHGLLVPPELLKVLCSDQEKPGFFGGPWCTVRRRDPPKKIQYANEQLHEKEDSEFFQYFRFTKKTYAFILDMVKQHYSCQHRGGNFPIDARLALDVTLMYLGSRDPYRKISITFGLSDSAVFASVRKIVQILCDIAKDFIKWPTAEEAAVVEKEFRAVAGFTGVIGVLGGTHIPIKAPFYMKADYTNESMGQSVILMATCDSKKKFTFIDVGFPGSVEYDIVFASSELHRGMNEDPQAYFPSPSYHIIGDVEFTLSDHVMVPFEETEMLAPHEVRYNSKLLTTRHILDNTYDLLRKRFRRLQFVEAEIKRIPAIVSACCILHNIAHNFPEEEVMLLKEGSMETPEEPLPHFSNPSEKRDFLSLNM